MSPSTDAAVLSNKGVGTADQFLLIFFYQPDRKLFLTDVPILPWFAVYIKNLRLEFAFLSFPACVSAREVRV